jgi:DNA-binding NarL/FixJ family response regulator
LLADLVVSPTRTTDGNRAREALAGLARENKRLRDAVNTLVLALVAEGRSNGAIAEKLVVSPKALEAHVRQIFQKLDLHESPDDHRRLLAVLAYLRSTA